MAKKEGQASIVFSSSSAANASSWSTWEAREALGRPFEIIVDVYAKLGQLDLAPHLGKPATVTIQEHESPTVTSTVCSSRPNICARACSATIIA
ncbi:hypothetical protein AB5I41_09365 [Sphingomonas sp. MMS24-JH45]